MMSEIELVLLAKTYIRENIIEPHVLNLPVFFRRLDDVVEFYDPAYNRYIRMEPWDLLQYAEGYKCSNCGGYHVPYVVDMTDPARPSPMSFGELLDLLKEMSKEEDEP